jgi:carbon storage regulator
MLVLSCKVGEQIVLPGLEATIAVVAVKGKVVRLGVSAPAKVAVHRKEVWRQIDRESQSDVIETPR